MFRHTSFALLGCSGSARVYLGVIELHMIDALVLDYWWRCAPRWVHCGDEDWRGEDTRVDLGSLSQCTDWGWSSWYCMHLDYLCFANQKF